MTSMETAEIEKLAQLSRIEITDEEKARLKSEFEAILGYISKINEIDSADDDTQSLSGNRSMSDTMRDDEISHKPNEYTEALLRAVPQRQGRYVEVKKIL